MKIVIVDDDKAIRDVLRTLCQAEGHEVVAELGSGVGLLDYVTSHQIDVVLLDFHLPGEDGLELLVNMNVTANNVSVIMITGSDDPELKGHAADLGATGFIRKPFEQAQIIAELKDIEETRRIALRGAENPVAAEPAVQEPAAQEAAAQEPAAAAPVPSVATVAEEAPGVVIPRTAVIVDDSGSIRLLLKGILEEIGIRILGSAANGREGIEIVKNRHPELVCLDVDMPGMTGIEALPQVRAVSPNTKVVMITGNASRAIVEAAVAGGARGYFLKPIRPAKVAEFLKKLLPR